MRTDDAAVITELVNLFGGHGSTQRVADALGIRNVQLLSHWRRRGIPPGWRRLILLWCQEHGHAFVDEEWCEASGDPLESALRQALRRRAAHRTKSGGNDGRAGKGKSRRKAGTGAQEQRQVGARA